MSDGQIKVFDESQSTFRDPYVDKIMRILLLYDMYVHQFLDVCIASRRS